MAETIQAFVEKLQADGIKAGQEAAEKIRNEADQEAKQLLDQAQAEARKIVDTAKAESEQLRARVQTELQLATRDAVTRLQDVLSRALRVVLVGKAQETLADADFLKALMHDIILEYVKAENEPPETVTLNVNTAMKEKLAGWAIEEFHKHARSEDTSFDLKGTLTGAGFEYKLGEGTVEITTDAAVDILSQMVSPELRKIIEQAVGNEPKAD